MGKNAPDRQADSGAAGQRIRRSQRDCGEYWEYAQTLVDRELSLKLSHFKLVAAEIKETLNQSN
jgi:hypothetical protein